MQYQNVDQLTRKLSTLSKTDATKKLTEFYAMARRKVSLEDFNRQFTDGGDDGGIDFFHVEDTKFFIFQTKFSGRPDRVNTSEILDEIRKLENTLTHENTNRKADDFVNSLKREKENKDAVLEYVFLTTNIVEQSVREQIQAHFDEWKRGNGWLLDIDFIAIDKHTLESVIYDVKHGYIPYTGKKTLKLEEEQWIETTWEETRVYSVVCSVYINDILSWFRNSDEIDSFLQKNVREFLGETGKVGKINKAIGQSYLRDANWFWYKHNGIIIIADNVFLDRNKMELILRNPQVINGGQTLKALFSTYDKNGRPESSAKILLRVYRLPYEDTETYKRSIDIISALNSQNKILPSDLRSTDPRQVRLEQLFEEIGDGYKYWRKRSKEAKSFRYSITMRNLALIYYVCKRNAPHEGGRGNVEELFDENDKYNGIFDENAINRELSGNHIVINYITAWNLFQIIEKKAWNEIPNRDKEPYPYTKWFVLVDIYTKLSEWKRKKFKLGWRSWVKFLEVPEFERSIIEYSIPCFRIGRKIIPRLEKPSDFLRRRESVTKFSRKTSTHKFEFLMNRAYGRFRRENE